MGQVEASAQLSIELGRLRLPDPDGGEHRLADLWAKQPLLLIHLRHFGCILCRQFASRLHAHHREFAAAGVRVVAIGTGGRRYAREFVVDQGLEFLLLVDRELVSHAVVGARSGSPLGLLRPQVVRAGLRARAEGHRQGRTGAHPFVFGATHLFARGGRPRFAWLDADYRDHPPIDQLLAQARDAAALPMVSRPQ